MYEKAPVTNVKDQIDLKRDAKVTDNMKKEQSLQRELTDPTLIK